MGHQDIKNGAASIKTRKKADRTRILAAVLLVLAVALCVVLVVVRKEIPEEAPTKKIIKKIPERAKEVRRAVPPLPKPRAEPWPQEGPLPYLAPIPPPAAVSPPSVPPPPAVPPPPEAEVPEVAKGRLFVDTDPAGATIRILNIRPPYSRGMALEEGSYHILVSNFGYGTQRRWVSVKGDTDNRFVFTLERIVTTGTLFVDSEPPGAKWFLDGSPAGVTPGGKEEVEKGDHLIVVEMDGYEIWSTTVSVKAGKKVSVKAALDKLGPSLGEVWREPLTGMVFVWIPEGCFHMGSPSSEAGRDPDEGPVHEVCLDGYWMSKTEVTNGQYRQFKPAHDSKAHNGKTLNEDNQPVVHVNWSDARAFARWLTEKNSGPFAFRLPTEAEWEFACRGGSRGARFWGENPDNACQFANVYDRSSKHVHDFDWVHHDCDEGYAVTAPVGKLRANPFGLHDMLGNVWEWCEDTYSQDAYQKHPKDNPVYTDPGGPFRVNRGGSWSDIPRSVRCAVRERLDPEFGNLYVGFRLVRTP